MSRQNLLKLLPLLALLVNAPLQARDDLDVQLARLIQEHGLTGDPSEGRVLPSIQDPIAHLGKLLFFSKALGGDMDAACVSCHHPMLGGGDGLALSIGVEAEDHDLLGPGREHAVTGYNFDGGPPVPRNAPTTFNIGLWDKVLFHDGRVESLAATPLPNGSGGPIRTPDTVLGVADPDAGPNLVAAHARFPVTSKEEMRGFVFEAGQSNQALRSHLAERLAGATVPPELITNEWLAAFRTAFDDPDGEAWELITFDNIAFAIGEYERSQVFVETPWKRYVEGDADALSSDAKAGAVLFLSGYEDGGFNCAACHSGDFFTDEAFHTLAMPQIGRGKGDFNGLTHTDDFGRERETGLSSDRYAFRTPSLLNVELTGPYGHAGAYETLEAAISHHLNPFRAVNSFNINSLNPNIQAFDMKLNTRMALAKLRDDMRKGRSPLQIRDASPHQINQLKAFLLALTDPCATSRDCLAPWIAGDADEDPDNLRLVAKNQQGEVL